MSAPLVSEVLLRSGRKMVNAAPAPLDVGRLREDFPILKQKIHGKPLVYLDNAATTQKPRVVIDTLSRYYAENNSNVHRGVHELSQRATRLYEEARVKVKRFINAADAHEIIFVRGATEGINLVAQSYGRKNIGAGDEIIVSYMEHHSNIVPWQMLCEEKGAQLRAVPINERGEFLLDEYEKLLTPQTRLVAVVHVSNSLGTINPVQRIIELAHRRGVPVLIDGAQATPHMRVDVQELDCDFYAFSGHKLYGPTGIGVLYGKTAQLEAMPPYQGGGDMIASVTFAKTTYNDLPYKFEAGTPYVAGGIGLGAAIDYLNAVGLENIAAHERDLLEYGTQRLEAIPGVRLIGTAQEKAAVISFVVEDPPLSALDVGTQLDLEGIAVRTGHHCCQPVMERFCIPGTNRASFALYNTREEIDALAAALRHIVAKASRPRPAPLERTALNFPAAAGASPEAVAATIADLFGFLDSWEDRYRYIIELGAKLPAMPGELKTEANRVRGCQSTVFLWARQRPGTTDVLDFLADSDADLVRGLLALLQKLFSGQSAAQVLAFDVEAFFRRLGLDQNLTLGRRNGLAEMVQRIRRFAAQLAARGSEDHS